MSAGDEWVPGGEAETGPTDGPQSPAEGGGDADGSQDAGDGFDDRSGGSSLTDRLFSTSPNVDVDQAAREFSTGSGWEGHASAAIQKLTGSEGTTALEHMLLAAFLWYRANSETLRETGETDDDGDSDETVPGTGDGKMVL